VILIDGRATFRQLESRFPTVQNNSFSSRDALEGIELDARTVALLMTHNFE